MKTRRLTCAQATIEFLKHQYVELDGVSHRLINGVFGIFGHGNVAGLGQAIIEHGGNDLPFHQPKNEQAMVHTAIAYAKTKRRLGTFACTTSVGPGATNMITGAAAATTNRLPVLLLPGDVFANRIPAPVLQQLEHPQSQDISVNDCFRPVSKYWDRINRPEQILTSLPEAMRILAHPADTGAVTLCYPEDVQTQAYDYPAHFFEKVVYKIKRTPPTEDDIKEAVDYLMRSKTPMMVVGGGVHYSLATDALEQFSEVTRIAMGHTQAGVGATPDTHPCNLGAIGTTGSQAANQLAKEADLILGLGTRWSDFTTASKTQFQNPDVKFINININHFDANKHGALDLNADIKVTLELLQRALLEKKFVTGEDYHHKLMSLKESWQVKRYDLTHPRKQPAELIHQSEVIGIFNAFADANTTVVHAAGGLPGDLHKLWRSQHPLDYHSEYAYSTMGYEIAGALGAKMATPEREVYAILGDGSYLMLNHELATSIQEDLKITLILLNNHGYQCIHNLQRACGSQSLGNEFVNKRGMDLPIDFVKNAQSLGAKTLVAHDQETFLSALKAAKQERLSTLIYLEVERNTPLEGFSWWDVPVSQVSTDVDVRTAREDYEQNSKEQVYYYGTSRH